MNLFIEELEEVWRPKWYISLYYKCRYYVLHGEWPLRIWRCKDMAGPVDGKLYQNMYKSVLEEQNEVGFLERDIWLAGLIKAKQSNIKSSK